MFKRSSSHVADESLLRSIDGEASPSETRAVQQHLASCWSCRTRRDQIEAGIHLLVEYRNCYVEPFLPPPPDGEARLFARLASRSGSRQAFRPSSLLLRLRPLGLGLAVAAA